MQEERRKFDPITADKIDEYCKKLEKYRLGECMPFTFIIEDPSGNSFIENPQAPTPDPYTKRTEYTRSAAEYIQMGYQPDAASLAAEEDKAKDAEKNKGNGKGIAQTKEEQEALLAKASAYASRAPVTSAAGVDFGKSVEE